MVLEKLKTAQTLDRWVVVFKGALKLATVKPHSGRFDAAELKRLSVGLPAVYVAALSAAAGEDVGDDTLYAETVFGAYILTGGQQRDVAGLNLQESIRSLLHTTHSMIDGVGRPKRITWQNIFSGRTAGQAVALNAIGWRQRILIGEPSAGDELFTGGVVWPADAVPENLYAEHGGETELVQGGE